MSENTNTMQHEGPSQNFRRTYALRPFSRFAKFGCMGKYQFSNFGPGSRQFFSTVFRKGTEKAEHTAQPLRWGEARPVAPMPGTVQLADVVISCHWLSCGLDYWVVVRSPWNSEVLQSAAHYFL